MDPKANTVVDGGNLNSKPADSILQDAFNQIKGLNELIKDLPKEKLDELKKMAASKGVDTRTLKYAAGGAVAGGAVGTTLVVTGVVTGTWQAAATIGAGILGGSFLGGLVAGFTGKE